MKTFVVLLSCLGMAMCAHPTLESIVAQVLQETDIDGNGCISASEFQNELLLKWDTSGDNVVDEHEFVNGWMHHFNDNHKDTVALFQALDLLFPKGLLTELDLLAHLGNLDPNGDSCVSHVEFTNFIHMVHPCGAHGHIHCTEA